MATTTEYIALRVITRLNGKNYERGDTVTGLSADQETTLLSKGVIAVNGGDVVPTGLFGLDVPYIKAINDRMDVLNNSLAQGHIGSINLLQKRKNDVLRATNKKISKWQYPSWFTWKDAPIQIFSDGTNFYTPFDVATFKNTGGKNIYVDPVNGIDTNNGLTAAASVKTVEKAYTLAVDGDTIICKAGIYKRTLLMADTTKINKSINIVSDGTGKVRWYFGDDHTFTKTTGRTNVYQTVRSNVQTVVDLQLQNINGETIALKKVADLATCDNTEGSWYNDGTNTYIRMLGDIVPTNANVALLLGVGNSGIYIKDITKNINVYVEGIEIYGGAANAMCSNSPTAISPNLYMKNCIMRYPWNQNSVQVLGGQYVFLQNCEASYSALDGFNYHASNGQIVKSIEVNCLGRGNGDNTLSTDINNGSTTHDGNKAIRINCTYYENMGVNCCDVQVGTQSINLGVTAFNSLASQVNSISHGNFSAQQAGTEMYLEGCVSFGSTFGIVPVTGTTMHLKNCLYDTTNGGGTLDVIA